MTVHPFGCERDRSGARRLIACRVQISMVFRKWPRTDVSDAGLGYFSRGRRDRALDLPSVTVPRADLEARLSVLAAVVSAGLPSSNGEVRRATANNAIAVDDARGTSDKHKIGIQDVSADGVIKLSLGKKRHVQLKPV